MSLQAFKDAALLLLYPLALLTGVYAYRLWRLVLGIHRKLDELAANCRRAHRHLDLNFLSAHRVEHQSLWEALHHHEHGPKRSGGRVIKIIGRG
ncbi:MAG: hypothetical protein QME75_06015 [Deltaproteobacteria bacterium]|nr:hypothetical protein [Deltaproteobacteria bacterium]